MTTASVRAFLPVFLLGPALLGAQVPSETASWTIPGISNVPGQNGTHFVSDVAVTNPGASLAIAVASFLPSGSYPTVPVLLAPGQTVVWRNVLQQLWGAATSGAMQIASTGAPLLIRARTYNDAVSGTFGVALPVYTDDRFLTSGDVGHSLWVSQSADGTKGYRTNVAVLFPDSGGGAATVTVYDGSGSQIGRTTFSLRSAGVQQIGVAKIAASADVARATIQVTGGRAAGYAAVVDNTTGDSSLFTFDDLPAGAQDELINGVARANGKNGTFFRTDGRFFNPGAQDVTVTAFFHASGPSNASPASGSVLVPAGRIVDVTDVLGTVLGQPVGSSGAVRFTAPAPVGILCRTSNVDPTGTNPGTFGAQQKPVPVLSFLTSADAGALVTGVRQSADPATGYRTNIALAAGRDGATVQLTLKSSAGVPSGSTTVTLGAWGWQQTAADKLFGVPVPDDAQVLVAITQGSADVFDSSVDNRSGDSVVTPAPALPVAVPASVVIGPAGGSVRSDDGRLTLKIPAGALAAPTAFSIVTGANGAPGGVGPGYTISPGDAVFARPVRIVMGYGREETNGSAPGLLGIAWQGASSWYGPASPSIDTFARTIAADLPSLQAAAARSQDSRAPLAGFGVSYGTYARLTIHGFPYAVQGGTRTFTAELVNVNHSGEVVQLEGVNPANFNYYWLVNHPEGGSFDGAQNAYGTTVTYTAPDCPPPSRVEITLDVHSLDGGPIASGNVFVRVLWKNWTYRIQQVDTVLCSSNLAGYGYTSDSSGEVTFSLAPDGQATNINTSSEPQNVTLTTCGSVIEGCTYALFTPYPLRVDSFNGAYLLTADSFVYSCNYHHMGSPGVQVTCPGGSGSQSPMQGSLDYSTNVHVDPYLGGAQEPPAGGGTGTEMTFELRPVKGACP